VSQYTAPIRRVDRGKNHYYLDANELRVPGVTTILKALPKDALINWAANATADAAVNRWDELAAMPPAARLKELQAARYQDRDKAANRGTEVHKLGEQLAAGHAVEYPDELAGHVEAYVRFLDEFDVQPVLIEAVVMSHKYGWAGTLDMVADFPTLGKRLLVDLKTSRSGVFGETALQLAAYRGADTYVTKSSAEKPMIPVDGCAAVHIRADGADLRPVESGPDQFRAFLYVQQVAAWHETSRDLIGDAVPPPKSTRLRIVREDVPA
jgi:hypothetical protein